MSEITVYSPEIVKQAPALNAAAVVIAHIHPSGNAAPSRDCEFWTATLKTPLSTVDVRVLDHFVVSATNVTGFA